MGITIQDSIFQQFRDFIYEKSGIFISDTKKYLMESRLVKRIQERNLNSFEDYLYLLKYSSNGNELAKLFDAITTNETFFFREPRQLDVFVDSVAPKIIEQNGTKAGCLTGKRRSFNSADIRVWSAACSTGEEPYTITMLFKERKMGVKLEVIASDIGDEVLEAARRAVYSSYSVRNIPELYLKKYFRADSQTYELDLSVKRSVRFMNVNLIDEKKMRSVQSMDVIFCRNVLIYFDNRAKQKAVSLLYDTLKPKGFLFIGSSESLHNVTRAFKPVIFNKVVVYQKP